MSVTDNITIERNSDDNRCNIYTIVDDNHTYEVIIDQCIKVSS